MNFGVTSVRVPLQWSVLSSDTLRNLAVYLQLVYNPDHMDIMLTVNGVSAHYYKNSRGDVIFIPAAHQVPGVQPMMVLNSADEIPVNYEWPTQGMYENPANIYQCEPQNMTMRDEPALNVVNTPSPPPFVNEYPQHAINIYQFEPQNMIMVDNDPVVNVINTPSPPQFIAEPPKNHAGASASCLPDTTVPDTTVNPQNLSQIPYGTQEVEVEIVDAIYLSDDNTSIGNCSWLDVPDETLDGYISDILESGINPLMSDLLPHGTNQNLLIDGEFQIAANEVQTNGLSSDGNTIILTSDESDISTDGESDHDSVFMY